MQSIANKQLRSEHQVSSSIINSVDILETAGSPAFVCTADGERSFRLTTPKTSMDLEWSDDESCGLFGLESLSSSSSKVQIFQLPSDSLSE